LFIVYVLFSPSLDRFYTGATSLPADQRVQNHLSHYYGLAKFTAKANDWTLFFQIHCSSMKQALALEAHIKRMHSIKYIQNLKSFPEMVEKLLALYPDS
jgi:putative endonuclease